MVCVRIIYIRV